MTLKTRLTELLHYIRDELLAFDSRLNQAERAEIGAADAWSAKDELVHNVVWAGRMLDDLEVIEGGEPAPQHDYGDFEAENRDIFEKYQHASWEEVRGMVSDVYGRIDAYVKRVGEAYLLSVPEGREQAIWRSIAGNGISHPMFHMWEYLEKHGYADLVADLFGEQFFERMLALQDDDGWRGTAYYNMACQYALTGSSEKAINNLAQALRLNPGLIEWSQQDSDLDSLRDDPAFQALYE